MVWFYLLFFLLIVVLSIIFRVIGLRTIRIFGFEMLGFLLIFFFLTMLIVEIIVPMPQYYIKHLPLSGTYEPDSKYSLNKILEDEVKKSGIDFDQGSFEILDSHGMSFNHLFLCSYQINGKEEVRVFPFKKNIFGNMKPEYPLLESYIIPKSDNSDDYYHDYVGDGFLGGYLVTAGYASENTVVENYQLNNFRMDQLHPSNYFMWVELVSEPWKSELGRFALILFAGFVGSHFNRKKRMPITFYSRWRFGDKIFQRVEDVNPLEDVFAEA